MDATDRSRRKVLLAATIAHTAQFSGIAQYARENDWHLVSDMTSTGTFPRGWTGDGILAVVGHQSDILSHVRNSALPCVMIARPDERIDIPFVEEDHGQIGRLAADHLLDRGYRSFAWAPMMDDKPNRDQLRGFQDRLAEDGCFCHILPEAHTRNGSNWYCDWAEYRRRLAAKLHELPRPTAIFAFNDSVAANLIDTCRDCGLRVPEQFAVLGVGNNPLVCDSVPVPLSSVELDHEQMAYRAAELLDRLMNGETTPLKLAVPAKGVIARVSTDVTAVADPRIARALTFIAENYSNPMLSVLDVAAAVGVSRRNLERNFRQVTGMTIREHIAGTRMQEASRLLTTHPRVKIAEVAELAGFAGAGNFFRTFRQFYGMSPHTHRARAIRDPALHAAADAVESGLFEPASA